MSQLIPQSPLMQSVAYQGETYYTSQYFHYQYVANSHHTGKHRRYDSFMRLLRNIEAYALYLQQGDIVEVQWNRDKPQECGYLKSLFQAAGYHPLTLLNATAQVAMSHHLDDELSKQVSVAANTTVARQLTAPAALDHYQDLKAIAEMARSVMSLAASAAESRLIAEAAQIEAQQAKTVASQADAKVEQLLHEQSWMTIHQYVTQHHLEHQIPESLQKLYATHLIGYCMEQGYRVYPQPVAYQRWEHENAYYVGAINATLQDWLFRRHAQVPLHLIHTQGDTP